MTSLVLITQLLLGSLSVNGPCSASDPQTQLVIQDIRAHLFYEHSGKLSRDITDPPQMVLWNTIIGGGDAAEPARNLLVVVVIEGPPECYPHSERLRLTATTQEEGGAIFQDIRVVGLIGADGQWAAPFLVTDTTCYSLTLTATLLGEPQEYSETIHFRCGE